ncbi:MAG: hypothetical protein ND895_11555, partial [Pyrinomonadaceae bacterium]|nr:hypothetical protein [Pyrinomonadaceae bacterium]
MKNKFNSRFTTWLLFCLLLLVVAPKVTAQNGWMTATPMTSARYGMATGVIDGKIYVAGGTSDGTNMLNTLEVFDPVMNTWSTVAPMPAMRYTAFAGVISGKLYVAGGHDGSSTVATLFVYDPATNTWSTLAPMPTARAILTGGVINGKLYVAGGYTSTTTFASINKLEVYDPATNTWATKKPMPNSGRYGAGAAVFSNRLYVAGGYGNDVGYSQILEVYDSLTDSWTAKTSMPQVQYLHAAGVLNGQLYTFGGYESAANPNLNRTQVYDPTVDAWSTGPALPIARLLPSAGVVGNSIHVIGGSNGTALTTHEVLTPPQSGPPQFWTVEKVAHISPLAGGCGPSVEISGLVHDSMNHPAVSWGVLNRCTFPGVEQFWARKDSSAWQQFTVANYNGPNRRGFRGASSLVMRADDNPFLVYADVGINFGVDCDGPLCPGITAHLANLAENPVGPGGIIETVGSGRSSCTVYPRFETQFVPSSFAPNWVTNLPCIGFSSVRLNGSQVSNKYALGFDYAGGPGGQNHIIFGETDVYYNNGNLGSDVQIAHVNSGGDVQIAADTANKLHAIIRGYNSLSFFDLGLMGYVTSTDGVNWTSPEIFDSTRNATRPALALDNTGNPAVAYWRSGELRFAYRRNGVWSNVHVITVPNAPYPEQKRLQLEFDKNNVPTIAFFDPCSNNIWLARPVTDSQSPVDLTLDISHSPDPLPPGVPLTYTIRVVNNGIREAAHVVVTETLPSNVSLISVSPAPVSQSGNTLYFDMGVVTPASNCAVITIKVMPTGPGPVTNVVSVTGDDSDADPDNNTITTNAEVRPAECFPPRNGMVAWWMAEGDANDTHNQNGFHGTIHGAVTFAPGKIGQAFNLNGTDAYIEVGDNASFNPTGSFSINAWVNTTTGGYIATKYECGSQCPAGANSLYFLYVGGGSGKVGFFLRDTAGNSQEIASSKVV